MAKKVKFTWTTSNNLLLVLVFLLLFIVYACVWFSSLPLALTCFIVMAISATFWAHYEKIGALLIYKQNAMVVFALSMLTFLSLALFGSVLVFTIINALCVFVPIISFVYIHQHKLDRRKKH